ncbi:MAG: ABC transporter permease [Calditrichaeota bacterium]|nr:MAG: ABC transporter permease [Calditrichota bacterium]
MWNLVDKSIVVFRKDFQLEFRTRYALNAIAMFALTTLAVISFSIGPIQLDTNILAPLLWVILFFSAMSGLSHIFVREEEQQTADTLRLVLPPNAIWLGKWLFNVILLFGLEIIIVPVYFAMMNTQVENLSIFFPSLILGSLGLASVSTIIAAIISIASSRGALFAVLAFPIALPILFSAINSTRLSMEGAPFMDSWSDLQVLLSFTIIIITTSLLVFEFVWKR